MDILYTTASLPGLEILSCADDRQFGPHLHDGYVLWLNSPTGKSGYGGEAGVKSMP